MILDIEQTGRRDNGRKDGEDGNRKRSRSEKDLREGRGSKERGMGERRNYRKAPKYPKVGSDSTLKNEGS